MTDIAALVADNIHIWTGAIQRKSSAGRGGGKRIGLYGIERLRVLILDLAVRGKLVPQDAADEPASELLKRMKTAHPTSRKQSKRRISLPFELQTGWISLPFGELAEDISTGPFGTMVHKGDYIAGGIPLINPSHMVEDRIVEDETVSLTISKADSLSVYRLEAGDIVFARRGDVGRLALVTDREQGWLCGTGSFRARFNGDFVQPYLLKFFRSHTARSLLGGASVGATMANLNQNILRELPISLPPLPEQRRIVAKVDELMALCYALERESADAMAAHQALVEALLATLVNSADEAGLARQWARLESHFDTLFTTDASIDALKQTILDLAVRGKIVGQAADDEPASKLIADLNKGVSAMQKEGLVSKRKVIEFARDWKPVFPLPTGWTWECFGNYTAELATGPFGTMLHQPDYVTGGVPLINPSHMIEDRIIEDEAVSLPMSKAVELNSYRLRTGDIVFARRGEVGRLAFVTDREDGWLCGTGSFRARFPVQSVQPYLGLFFRSLLARKFLGGESVGATMSNLNHSILNRLPIPIPPLAEQHRIVAKVDDLMALCDALKTRLADAAETQRHLADAITERAAA